MSRLSQLRDWLQTAPALANSDTDIMVDYTDDVPGSAGLFPSGTQEVSRTHDVLGGVRIVCRDAFAVYIRWPYFPDSETLQTSEEVLERLADWIREQSAARTAPVFGDDPIPESVTAGQGRLWGAEDGSSIYSITVTLTYIKTHQGGQNPWLI